jgi:FG-GAP-like repeat
MRNVHFVCLGLILVSTLSRAQSNPVPFIDQPLVPMSAAPGGPGFTLRVNGAGFASGAVVNWNGAPLPTTFVSKAQVTATVVSSDIASASTASVTVSNPRPGGGVSNVSFFQIAAPLSTVVFSAPTYTGADGFDVITADFNGDGNLDLAVTGFDSENNATVYIQLGNGDGTFRSPISYPIAIPSQLIEAFMATGDFNGDGKLDLVAGLSLLLGNGDGTFRPGISLPPQYTPGANDNIVAGDFNGDGKLDLAAMENDGYDVLVMLGNGDGTFTALAPIQVGSPQQVAVDLAVADFNGDAVLDLIVDVDWIQYNAPSTFDVFLGNGDGTFQQTPEYTTAVESGGNVAADFNGDDKVDLANCNAYGTPFATYSLDSVSLGNGDGTFDFNPNGFVAAGSVGCPSSSGDFNADGKLDLVVETAIALGNGDGTFQATTIALSPLDAFGPYSAADLNGDGRLDAVGIDQTKVFVQLQILSAVPQISPGSLAFSTPQLVGSTGSPLVVTLTNIGNSSLTINSIKIAGTNGADFAEVNTCGTSLAISSSCKINVTFTPTAGSTRSADVQITDNAPGSPQTVALTGTGQDFSLALSTQTSMTVTPGETANYTVTISPIDGFDQKIALSCSGAPPQSTCTISPSSVTLNGSANATASVAVVTAGPSATLRHRRGGGHFALWFAFPGLSGVVILAGLSRRSRRHGRQWRKLFALLGLLVLVITWPACGGGGGSGSGTGTPAGTYTVTVTGTFTSGSATLTHSTKLTLVVN